MRSLSKGINVFCGLWGLLGTRSKPAAGPVEVSLVFGVMLYRQCLMHWQGLQNLQ